MANELGVSMISAALPSWCKVYALPDIDAVQIHCERCGQNNRLFVPVGFDEGELYAKLGPVITYHSECMMGKMPDELGDTFSQGARNIARGVGVPLNQFAFSRNGADMIVVFCSGCQKKETVWTANVVSAVPRTNKEIFDSLRVVMQKHVHDGSMTSIASQFTQSKSGTVPAQEVINLKPKRVLEI